MNRGRPLPWKLREQIRRLLCDGHSQRAVARLLRLSRNTVAKYLSQQV